MMRPSFVLGVVVVLFIFCDAAMFAAAQRQEAAKQRTLPELQQLVAYADITDLCLSTEARYIRHLAVSDPMAPFMDHPGAIEHFPSGSFYYPPLRPFPAR